MVAYRNIFLVYISVYGCLYIYIYHTCHLQTLSGSLSRAPTMTWTKLEQRLVGWNPLRCSSASAKLLYDVKQSHTGGLGTLRTVKHSSNFKYIVARTCTNNTPSKLRGTSLPYSSFVGLALLTFLCMALLLQARPCLQSPSFFRHTVSVTCRCMQKFDETCIVSAMVCTPTCSKIPCLGPCNIVI